MSALEKAYNSVNEFSSRLIETILSILKIIIRYRKTPPLSAITNDTCYILGNGPSLNTTFENHLNALKEKDMVCVNLFALSEYFEKLKPQNYVIIDEIFYKFDNKEHNRQDFKLIYDKFSLVNWDMNFYIPIGSKTSYLVDEVLKKNKHITINYFNYIVVSGFDKFKFYIYNKELGMPQCQNVLAASIFLSINRGYKDIYIFGADHSWHQQISVIDDNKIMLNNQHFYNATGNKVALVKNLQNRRTTADIFLSLHKAFKTYEILNSYASYRNCNVYNASEVSFIDAFKQKKL